MVLTSLVFWGVAERLFNVRQGKRLFSLIGAGELAASILGGFATPLLVPVLGTHNLLLVSALSLIACLGLLIVTLRTCTAPLTQEAEAESTAQATPHSLTHLLKQRYVMLVVLVQMLFILVYYFIDFTFYAQTQARYQTEAQLANFLGPFLGMVETVNLLTRTLFSSRLITRYVLRVGLLVHPLGLMGFSVLLAVTGTTAGMSPLFFWLTALTKLCDEVLWKAIEEPVFSLSTPYQPSTGLRSKLPCSTWGHSPWPPAAPSCSWGRWPPIWGTSRSSLVVLAGAVVVALKVRRGTGALKQALTSGRWQDGAVAA
jgi:hypothetical protein